MRIYGLLPVCVTSRTILDCTSEWDGFKLDLHQFIRMYPNGSATDRDSLYESARSIVNQFSPYTDYTNPSDEYSIPVLAQFVRTCNTAPANFTAGDCLYGLVNALWVVAFASNNMAPLHTALAILGERTRRNLDFIESSDWPIRTVDIVHILDDPSRPILPLIVPNRSPLSIRTPMEHSFAGSRRDTVPSNNHTHLTVWEVGVHASLTAEVITMLTVTRPHMTVIHRRLIQDQYPRILTEDTDVICSQMYAVIGICDTVNDTLTAFFRERIPWSAFSSDPIPDISALRLAFQAILVKNDIVLPDIVVCTIPALCLLFAGLYVKVVGYFGHPLLFMTSVADADAVVDFFQAKSNQHTFVVTDPFLAMQYQYTLGGSPVPFVRTLGLYTGVRWTGGEYTDILVWDRPHDVALMCALQAVLTEYCEGHPVSTHIRSEASIVRTGGVVRRTAQDQRFPYRFVSKSALAEKTYLEFSKFAAVVLFPYDMDLVAFYEFTSMGIPILIPSSAEKYLFSQGHMKYNREHSGEETGDTQWRLSPLSPLNESNLEVTLEQLKFSDYFRSESVAGRFANFQELFKIVGNMNFTTGTVDPIARDAVFKFWSNLI